MEGGDARCKDAATAAWVQGKFCFCSDISFERSMIAAQQPMGPLFDEIDDDGQSVDFCHPLRQSADRLL